MWENCAASPPSRAVPTVGQRFVLIGAWTVAAILSVNSATTTMFTNSCLKKPVQNERHPIPKRRFLVLYPTELVKTPGNRTLRRVFTFIGNA